ncbi:quinoprotein dehydrogenase-associated putative ABC transporter substrate-binding protein [Azospirillum melinis]|uniref:Quinoprotein dehydrogenase-associated putative ABC transporter substrate-binding protein n=1 Tax=Azospirillum melinis TaxID=328839 RepID=A0ABX2K6C1_9PROT|nr:substrate-binding domain-containing protein [Azospirillum melinis]NUA99071.1 quinoprotein dehydrogenase-associated putative ABC transporter substrate-binding protein [Azospirillum melinis]
MRRPSLPTLLVACLLASPTTAAETLRVCADPNNLPYSNDRGEGFENRIMELLAHDMGIKVGYTWWAQRRGFIRNTLKAGLCDVIAGVPSTMEMLAVTRPYYRSTYVFVTATDRGLDIRSFDDPRLRSLKVGVQMIGDDFSNAPPAHALSRRGIVTNVRGYLVYGDYTKPNPTARIVEAVVNGELDVAVVWGPQAGYFAARQPAPLTIMPVTPGVDSPTLPMMFDISMGLRKEDVTLRRRLEDAVERNRAAIDRILADYGVPRTDPP